MIDKLTKEQKEKISEYTDKWIKIGLSTERFKKNDVRKHINDLYTNILKRKEVPIFIFDNPILAWVAIVTIWKKLHNRKTNEEVGQEIRQEVWQEIWQKIEQEVGQEIRQEVWQEVMQEVWQEVWQEVRQEIGQKVGQEVIQEVIQEVKQEVEQEVIQEVKQEVEQEVWQEIWQEVGQEVEQKVEQEIGQEVWQEVGREVIQEVIQEIWQEVGREVGQEVGQKVEQEIGQEVWQEVGQEVGQKVWQKVQEVGKIVLPYLYGSFDIWVSLYDFFYGEVLKRKNKKLEILINIAKVGFVWAFKDFCVVSQKPSVILKNMNGLHADGKPALEYAGLLGSKLYFLNGVKVSKHIVETPAEQLDPKLALDEKNADVQREIIRKIGYERILKSCNAKTIEEWRCPKTDLTYKVQAMKMQNIDRRYLCYEHASMPGIYYAKCMPPEAKTIIQMRAFQTGVFGFNPEEAREGLRRNNLTDEQLLAMLPESVQ